MAVDDVARRAARAARLEARDVRALAMALGKRMEALEASCGHHSDDCCPSG
jgi:hypothetical protein